MPSAELVLQLDEPSLPAVLAGHVRTASGFGALRTPEPATVQAVLSAVDRARPATYRSCVHCCAADPPLRLFRDVGAAAVSIDAITTRPDYDALGELVEAGVALWLGVVSSTGPGRRAHAARGRRSGAAAVARARLPGRRSCPMRSPITPTCGLAGASLGWAYSAYRVLRQAARTLAEAPEGTSV